jgi:hypothetical protein
MASPDPWHCRACGATSDLAAASVEVGLVRLAERGGEGFQLGSAGIEALLEPVLAACGCGGRLAPGTGHGERRPAAFDADLLRPLAARGWAELEATPALEPLREVWRPRALLLMGRGEQLAKEDVLRLRLEDKLAALQAELERAAAEGDDEAAETAHARYIELGTTYVRRFVRPDDPAARPR